jgi:predicted DNA binding protein
MRYVTLRITPTAGGGFHPVSERIARAEGVTREAIHRVDNLGDGTVTMLARVSGDGEHYRSILAESPEVHEFTVAADEDGDGVWGFSRIEINDLVEYMLARDRDLELVRDGPIEITDDGGQRVTLVGTEEAFARAAALDDPERYDVEIEKTGEYHPESGRLLDALTARQREILECAVGMGYYDDPRRATQDDLAAELDCAPATVGEHLRKIERAVMGSLVG